MMRAMSYRTMEILMKFGKALSATALLAISTAVPSMAMAQTRATNLPWCGIVDGDWECVYPTQQECVRWMQPEGQACAPNPRAQEEPRR